MAATYLLLAGAWFAFGGMAVAAFMIHRRGKKIERWIVEERARRAAIEAPDAAAGAHSESDARCNAQNARPIPGRPARS